MHHFTYKNGVLHAEDVALPKIAEDVGTPFYCYSQATMTRHYTVFRDAFGTMDVSVCFAMKANSNLAVVRTLAQLGAGADVVSGGELQIALKAGVPAEKIVFSGVGKTDAEIRLALACGVGQMNVESEDEIERISAAAAQLGKKIRIALRVNPDVAAGTLDKISTGRKDDKFGIDWTLAMGLYRKARQLPGLLPTAIAVHIGSQITNLAPFESAFLRVRDLALMLRGEGIPIDHLDLGGGLGVPYDHGAEPPPSPADYAAMVKRTVGELGCKLTFEPGRLIVGNAGVMVSRVIGSKDGATRRFVIVDAAMNDLVRPAMYGARHEILPVKERPMAAPIVPVDVVGPVCETTDRFAQDYRLPQQLEAGDLMAFMTAGAYGAVMASRYNARPLIPEVLVKGDSFAVVRRRPTFEQMMALEQLPPWLA